MQISFGRVWWGVLGVAAFLCSGAQAATRVGGTELYYSDAQDPITDINTGSIWIYEQYDTEGDTRFTMRCDNRGKPEFWSYITNKNDLLSDEQVASQRFPAVTVRLGDDPAFAAPPEQLVSVSDQKDRLHTRSIGFDAATTRSMVRGLRAGKRLALRVKRLDGGQPLTFIFPAQGFNTAWQGVRACDNSKVGAPRPAGYAPNTAPSTSAALPKFTQWYFGACRDKQTGKSNTGLLSGRDQLCELTIETAGNLPQPQAAGFQYELEYREGGRSGKFRLDGTDRYSAQGGGNVAFRREGNKLVFTLPLNVRKRSGRVYTSINVIGDIAFAGGSKRVYEPLPIR